MIRLFIINIFFLYFFSSGHAQIVATDQFPPSMCEDNFGSSRVVGVDMTALEPSIYSGSGVTFAWFSDQYCSLPIANPNNKTVIMGDIYYVVVDNGVSSDTATVSYTIYEIPYFWEHSPAPLCEDFPGGGTASNIDLTSHHFSINGCSTTQFTWYYDVSFSNPVQNPNSVTVSNGQKFYVELYNTLYQCSNSTSIVFTVNSKPIAINIDTNICLNIEGSTTSSVNLTDFNSIINGGQTANLVTWFSDSNHSALIEAPVNLSINNPITTFYAIISNGSCQNSCELIVGLYPNPKANFFMETNTASLLNPTFNFTNQSSSNTSPSTLSYSWFFEGSEFSSYKNTEYRVLTENIGNYNFSLTVKDINGCINTSTQVAKITEAHNVYIPNAFTPNGDGVNDIFAPSGFGISDENYSLIILNRSGIIVFESRKINESWNGNYNGQLVPTGTYVLKLVYDDLNGIQHEKISQLNIL